MPNECIPTREELEHGLNSLLLANRHAKNKGAELFKWLQDSFVVDGRVSHITEDRQCGNRVSEQFRYKPDVVIFLCDDCVKEESLLGYIQRNLYSNIKAVLVVANRKPFAYLKLYIGKRMSNFARWCEEELHLQPVSLFPGTLGGGSIESKQIIYYGAPGTGKSYAIDATIDREEMVGVRTTFHPDSDYSSFVGAYKPQMTEDDYMTVVKTGHDDGSGTISTKDMLVKCKHITYEFSSQAFMDAYLLAWEQLTKGVDGRPVALVIEEINRGNCAQIFGDLFQLLDRDDDGYSSYPIDADVDIFRHIAPLFAKWKVCDLPCPEKMKKADWDQVKFGKKLALPANLYIWATMNTSDQSLFPIDSAFKRRWDWEYMPIKDEGKGWYIKVGEVKYEWWSFLKKINEIVFKETDSADKKMGYFFVKLPKGQKEISVSKFVNKVAFYLWNDVFKDCEIREDALKLKDDKGKLCDPIRFTDFFLPHSNVVNEKVVTNLLDGLGVEKVQPEEVKTEGAANN